MIDSDTISAGAAFNAAREALLSSPMKAESEILLAEIMRQDVRIGEIAEEKAGLSASLRRALNFQPAVRADDAGVMKLDVIPTVTEALRVYLRDYLCAGITEDREAFIAGVVEQIAGSAALTEERDWLQELLGMLRHSISWQNVDAVFQNPQLKAALLRAAEIDKEINGVTAGMTEEEVREGPGTQIHTIETRTDSQTLIAKLAVAQHEIAALKEEHLVASVRNMQQSEDIGILRAENQRLTAELERRPNAECVEPDAKTVSCCICSTPVKACERKEPVGNDYTCPAHPDGCELSDGRWVCSELCWDKATDESTCRECQGSNIVWFTDNPTWNRVMGGDGGIICPICFVGRAEKQGIDVAWELRIDPAFTSGSTSIETQLTEACASLAGMKAEAATFPHGTKYHDCDVDLDYCFVCRKTQYWCEVCNAHAFVKEEQRRPCNCHISKLDPEGTGKAVMALVEAGQSFVAWAAGELTDGSWERVKPLRDALDALAISLRGSR